MVDFGGWDMPVNYGSQIEEHHAVRRDAGIFDVSHMCVIDVARPAGRANSSAHLLANDVAKLTRARQGAVQLHAQRSRRRHRRPHRLFPDESWFRVVVNAGTRDKDLAWMRGIAPQFGVELTERTDLAMLAVQGPNARAKVARAAAGRTSRRPRWRSKSSSAASSVHWFVARTGYTGEDGFEIMLPAAEAARVWRALNAHGREIRRPRRARHAAARSRHESLRQRHGREPEPARVRPRLDRVVRDPRRATSSAARRSRRIEGRGRADEVRRRWCSKTAACCAATRRSSSPASAKAKSPAARSRRRWRNRSRFARVPRRAPATTVQVDIRGKLLTARVVKAPFVRNGKILVS